MAFSGTNTNLNISGNILGGNGTGAITGTYPTSSIVVNNSGVAAILPTTPAIPATTVEQQNTFAYPVMVVIQGGAGATSVIAKGPTSGALRTTGYTLAAVTNFATVILQPQEYIALTYTTAPTWVWFGQN